LIQVKVIEGVFTEAQKREIVHKLTDAMVSIEGENMRSVTWMIVEEVKSGDWGDRREVAGPSRCEGTCREQTHGSLITGNKAAGKAAAAQQALHRPGTAPALGLRAGKAAIAFVKQIASLKEKQLYGFPLSIPGSRRPTSQLLEAA
jgi:4-oxalocrotonate tautomerase